MEGVDAGDGLFLTKVPGLVVMRASQPTRPQCILYRPTLCLILQGAKEMMVGATRSAYHEGQSVVVTQDVPTITAITAAQPERPFLGLGLELDVGGMRDVAAKLAAAPSMRVHDGYGVFEETTSTQIADCVTRLIQLASHPAGLAILGPSIMREVYYWLLIGPNGDRIVKQIGITGAAQRIASVVQYLRRSFAAPIKMEQLAEMASMSPSSFYEHFKTVTSVSPLQFQKQLKLTEARRLLLMGGVSVAGASSAVGYESTSQFSREYARMFGRPPARDTSFFYDRLSSPREAERFA